MALARSASGPGGLSINTSSANSLFGSSTTPATGGMFGSTQAKPAGGGLFGSSAAAPQTAGLFGSTPAAAPAVGGLFGSAATPSTAGGLFAPTQAAAQPTSGGLFGSSTQAQPASGGLFGATPAAKPATSGLFGNAQTPAPQSGGLFGSATPAQAPAGGSLFSGLGTQQPQAQASTGGMFGSSTPAAGGGGLFGGLNNQAQAQPSGCLFGGLGSTQTQQPQQQQQTSNLFGQSQAQGQATGGFGGSTLGGLGLGQQNNQQQTVPGVRIDMSNIRGTTRYNDLHEDLQKQITQIDTIISNQIQLKNECDAIMPSHDSHLTQIPIDVEFCRRKLIGVENGQDSDVQSIAIAAQLVKTDAEHAKLSFKAVDNLQLPPQYHNSGIWATNSSSNESQSNTDGEAQDIVSFFSKTADELKATLEKYQSHVTEIEQHLRGVEQASVQQINALVARRNGSSRTQSNPAEDLGLVLREFEQSVLGVAGRVGGAREALQTAQLDGFNAPVNGRPSGNGRRNGVY